MKQSSDNPTSNWHHDDVGLTLDCFMKPGPVDVHDLTDAPVGSDSFIMKSSINNNYL